MSTPNDTRMGSRSPNVMTPFHVVAGAFAALAAWEIGNVVATQVILVAFGSSHRVAFIPGDGWQFETVVILLLGIAIRVAIALPVALLALRPLLRAHR